MRDKIPGRPQGQGGSMTDTPNPSDEYRAALTLARAAVEGPEPGPREVVPAAEYVRLARVALAARQPAPTVSAEQVQSIASESGRPESVVRDWLRVAGIEVTP